MSNNGPTKRPPGAQKRVVKLMRKGAGMKRVVKRPLPKNPGAPSIHRKSPPGVPMKERQAAMLVERERRRKEREAMRQRRTSQLAAKAREESAAAEMQVLLSAEDQRRQEEEKHLAQVEATERQRISKQRAQHDPKQPTKAPAKKAVRKAAAARKGPRASSPVAPAKSEPEPEPQPEPASEPEPEPQPEPEPMASPKPKATPQPASEAEPAAAPSVGTKKESAQSNRASGSVSSPMSPKPPVSDVVRSVRVTSVQLASGSGSKSVPTYELVVTTDSRTLTVRRRYMEVAKVLELLREATGSKKVPKPPFKRALMGRDATAQACESRRVQLDALMETLVQDPNVVSKCEWRTFLDLEISLPAMGFDVSSSEERYSQGASMESPHGGRSPMNSPTASPATSETSSPRPPTPPPGSGARATWNAALKATVRCEASAWLQRTQLALLQRGAVFTDRPGGPPTAYRLSQDQTQLLYGVVGVSSDPAVCPLSEHVAVGDVKDARADDNTLNLTLSAGAAVSLTHASKDVCQEWALAFELLLGRSMDRLLEARVSQFSSVEKLLRAHCYNLTRAVGIRPPKTPMAPTSYDFVTD